MPQRPHGKHVRGSTAQNKKPEQKKHPGKREIAPASDEVDQTQRNQKVGQRDQRIGNGMEPDQVRQPQAVAVSHEVSREQLTKKFNNGLKAPTSVSITLAG